MNDADLSAALHRGADLAGEPAPDLLDQLSRRRVHQRHQRLGMAAAVLGVVLVAGGIPLGFALADHPDGRTAHTPPVTTAPAPTSPTSAAPALPAPPGCPDAAALFPLLSAGERADGRGAAPGPATCSGDWALIGVRGPAYQSVALFRFVDGGWTEVDRSQACSAGDVPAALVDGTCNAG
jgi:hypothetical protein